MELFRLFGTVLIDDKKAIKELKALDQKAQNNVKTFNNVANAGKAIGKAAVVGTAAAGAAIWGLANKSASTADEIDKMSQKLGLSREGYQEWSYVLSQSGIEIESMSSGMKTLTTRISEAGEGAGKGAELFEQMGITITDSMTQEDVFNATVKAMQGMEDGTEKAALAIDLFGKSGQDMMPLLNGSAESVENLKDKAEELGIILDDETIDAGVEFTDSMDSLKTSLGAVGTNLGTIFLPYLTDFSDWVTENMPTIQEKMDTFAEGLETGVNFLIENKDIVLPILGAIAAAILAIAVAQTILNIAMYANPAILIATAIIVLITSIVAAIALVVTHWDEFKAGLIICWDDFKEKISGIGEWLGEKFTSAVENIKEAFSGIGEFFEGIWEDITSWFTDIGTTIGDAVSGAFKSVINAVIGWAEGLINNFLGSINNAIDFINMIPGVEISKLTLVELPQLAQGGYVKANSPRQVIIGDNTREGEIVAPESKLREMAAEANGGKSDKAEENTRQIVELLSMLIEMFSNQSIDWNDREIGRVIRSYV